MLKPATPPNQQPPAPSIKNFVPDNSSLDEGEIPPDRKENVNPPEEIIEKPPIEPIQPKAEDDFDITAGVPIKPDRKPPGRPSNNAMRSELEKVAAERKQFEADLQREREERKAEQMRLQELEDQVKKVAAEQQPPVLTEASPEIRAIADPWNRRRDEFTTMMEDAGVDEVDQIPTLLQNASKKLFSLDPRQEGYRDAVAEIRESLAGIVPREHLPSAMSLVRDGAKTIGELRQLHEQAQQNAPEIIKKRRAEAVKKERDGIENLMQRSFSPPKELADADPLASSVILRTLLDKDTDLSDRAAKIRQAAIFAMSPLPDFDASGIEDPRVAEQRSKDIATKHKKMRDDFIGLMPEAIMAYQLLPTLIHKLNKLEENVGKSRASSRMKLDDEAEQQTDDEEASIKDFDPGPINVD